MTSMTRNVEENLNIDIHNIGRRLKIAQIRFNDKKNKKTFFLLNGWIRLHKKYLYKIIGE